MGTDNSDKVNRVLGIYKKLMDGYVVNKAQEALNYGVNERSIQRDIEDIKQFLDVEARDSNSGVINSVVYDRRQKGYQLEEVYNMKLKNSEILAICKILLESRAFTKPEMTGMLERLIDCCVPKSEQRQIKDLIENEEYHYIELQHKSVFIDKMWEIGLAVRENRYLEFEYRRSKDNAVVKRRVQPVAILFSEFYFYLTAFIEDEAIRADFDVLNDSFPTIYRIDRIVNYTVSEEHFHIPYRDRFEEGEFRKRIQFMYGGKMQRVKFKYRGDSVEAVLDRLPTAKIIEEKNGECLISAEAFGKGIEMWLRSQGGMVEVIEMREVSSHV